MPANLEVTPSSYSTLRVSWGAAPGATQYMILYSALNHGEPDDAKEVGPGSVFLSSRFVCDTSLPLYFCFMSVLSSSYSL